MRERPAFSWQHGAAILLAVGITVAIYLLRDSLTRFSELAYAGAFLAMIVGNATILLPVPGLIVIFALGGTLQPVWVGLAGGAGAALGEMTGYAAGFGGSPMIDKESPLYEWMARFGLALVIVLAIIPNPFFDAAGVIAGAMRITWWQFLLTAWLGKTIQALLVALAGAYSLQWVESLLS
ncbi:MAG: VTT domain-containing protein [Chloroflexi bacterium]|nr:VTT domain-containing protein [Chloroflexota bacterium]